MAFSFLVLWVPMHHVALVAFLAVSFHEEGTYDRVIVFAFMIFGFSITAFSGLQPLLAILCRAARRIGSTAAGTSLA